MRMHHTAHQASYYTQVDCSNLSWNVSVSLMIWHSSLNDNNDPGTMQVKSSSWDMTSDSDSLWFWNNSGDTALRNHTPQLYNEHMLNDKHRQ